MKKLTLTFCALFALLVVAPALYADGPEKYSGKEKEVMQPAPPVCDFYRAHEWDLSIWGAYAFAADTGQFNVPNDDPFFPDSDVTNETVLSIFGTTLFVISSSEPRNFNPNERVNIGRVSKNQLFARDDVWGGGADVKYFWSRYFGVGQEDHADKIHLITEQGISTTTFQDVFLGTFTTNTPVINQAFELRPGHGSDNQDFGMARFGVTFSY